MKIFKKWLVLALFLAIFMAVSSNAGELYDEYSFDALYENAELTEYPEDELAPDENPETDEIIEDEVETGTAADNYAKPVEFTDDVLVQLPTETDFDIVILSNEKTGFVNSEEFRAVNLSDSGVYIELAEVYLELWDSENFNVSAYPELSETGNNIYMEVIASYEGVTKIRAISQGALIEPISFYLEGGGELVFRFQGTANEFGYIPWDQTDIKVRIVFRITAADF